MRIKKIMIKEYGPIKNFHTHNKDINIIYGRNEAGKTALIDAITGALFQKKSIFPGQDRFEKTSSLILKKNVTLVLEDSGKEYTFPGSFKLEELINLPHYHLVRLFIIRAGDLTLQEQDKKWQDKVKEFLSGMPVNVEKIKEKIGEEVGLTPGGEWSNRKPARKKSEIRGKEEREKDLIEAIERLKSINQKERTLRDKLKEREKLREKSRKIKLLRAYLLNQRVKQTFSEWSRQRALFLDYQRYLEEDHRRWLSKEREQESLLNRRQSYEEDLREIKAELDKINKEKTFLEEEKKELISQKDRAFALSIFQDAERLSFNRENLASFFIRVPLYRVLGLALSLSGILLFFTTSLKGLHFMFVFLSIFLLGGGGYFLISSYLIKNRELNLRSLEDSILEKGRKVWPGIKNINQIMRMGESVEVHISQVTGKLEYISQEIEKKSYKLKEKEKELGKVEKKMQGVGEKIKKLRDRTGLSDFSQLEEKLRKKQQISLNISSKEESLQDSLGVDDPSLWEQEAKREVAKPDIKEEELTKEEELDRELSQLNKDIQDLTAEITSFTQGELGRLGIKEVTEIWKELKRVEDALNLSYVDRDAALLAWDAFDEVGREMEEVLVNTVSDEKSGVSFYFNRITSGRYRKVRWDKGSICVIDTTGKNYSIETLSSGTQDQLFFSLRLGILKGGFPQGVFILLDDAFLTSDAARRESQVRVCKNLAEEGWQIFYFTVDEALRDLFCQVCEIEPINL